MAVKARERLRMKRQRRGHFSSEKAIKISLVGRRSFYDDAALTTGA